MLLRCVSTFARYSSAMIIHRELPPLVHDVDPLVTDALCHFSTLRESTTDFQGTPQYLLNYQICPKSIHRMISSLYSMPAVAHIHLV